MSVCSGASTTAWTPNNTCWAYNDGPNVTGSMQYICAASGNMQIAWFETQDCSGEPESYAFTAPPNTCVQPPHADDGAPHPKNGARFRPRDNDDQSALYSCISSSAILPIYPLSSVTTAITSFNDGSCAWDTVKEQWTVSMGQCSPILASDSGMFHPQWALLHSCDDSSPTGMAVVSLYGAPGCPASSYLGDKQVPTGCSQSGRGSAMMVKCKLDAAHEEKSDNSRMDETRMERQTVVI